MAQAQRYKLTLSKLDFISLVDDPAQPNATTLLIKRKGVEGETKAKLVKADSNLGLAFFWAFTSTEKSGEAHYDHHGDAVQADDAMVKAAMEFMTDANGAVDEMHDYEQKSRVVFAMPMTKEIASSFGIKTEQTGLMIAIKVNDDQLAKLRDGTYTGVSIAGLGTREPIEARKSLRKSVSLFTDEIDGHQHQIDIGDDGYTYCSWATSAGAENGHSHAIARDENGAIVILADSGHSHELAAGQPAVIVVPEGAVVVTEVAMRRLPIASSPTTNPAAREKRASGSPRSAVPPKLDSHTEKSTMTTQNNETDKVAKLEKHLASIRNLSETEFAIWKSSNEPDAFLAASPAERAPIVKAREELNAVEYTALDGTRYTKAKAELARLHKMADDERTLRLDAEISKRTGDMLGTSTDAAVALVKALESIADGTKREDATKLLKGLVATSRIGKSAQGADGGNADPNEATAAEQLDNLTTKYAAEKSVAKHVARVAVMKTAEGKRLYAESIGRA